MDRIIEEGLRELKSRIEEISGRFGPKTLTPENLSRFEHKLHDALGALGRTVEKAVLEAADVQRPSIDHGGMRHYWKYRGPQEYQCLFGKIEVRRSVYQANGERTLCPLEVNAGILHHHLTPSETVIKHVAAEVGELSEMIPEIYEDKVHEGEGPAPEKTSVVTISRDATAVNIREEGWRHAQAGSISYYGPKVKNKKGKKTRKRLRTVYLGQMPEERTPTFDEKFEREIDHTLETLPPRTQLACLADGARSIWKYFESHPRLKKAVHINDFWHTAEKLSDVSKALFGEGTTESKRWYGKYRRILKTEIGGVDKLIHSIRYYKRTRAIRSSSRRDTICRVLGYLGRNRQRMKYAEYRRRGLPIGSGVVEAACKTLVGHRFKRAGMRWSIDGGQKILNLRAARLSKRWDVFWQCHQQVIGADRVNLAA